MDLPPTPQPTTISQPPSLKKPLPLGTILIFIVVILVLGVGFYLATSVFKLGKKTASASLTYWGLWEQESSLKPLIDEYTKDHPNIKITYIFQSPQEYRERLQNALSQGHGPDIFRLHNSWIPMFKNDLDPVPTSIYSAADFESTFYPTVRQDLRLGTNYLAIPLEIDGLAMYVNDDLLAKSNQQVPQTWEDLRKVAKSVSVCDSQDGTCSAGDHILISGAALGTADNVDHWQDILAVLMLQNGVNLNAPSGQSAEDALSYYTIFNRSDHIWDSNLPHSTQAFAEGKLAVYFAPSWRIFELRTLNPNLRFSVHPIPQLPIDPARGEKPITWASYWVEGVNKKSQSSKEAWDFLKFLSSKESLPKLYQSASRIFGEPYSRQDLGSLLLTDPLVGPYISQAPTARSWYLASSTYDGPTGINSRFSALFATAVNNVNQNQSPTETIKTLNTGVGQVLSQYGITPANQ